MPTVRNEDAARPQLLYIMGGIITAVSALIYFNAATDDTRGVAALFWVSLGLPLLVFAVLRARVLRSRGETFLNFEPSPLVLGQPFSGYIECGRSLDIRDGVIRLQVTKYRYESTTWDSGNLIRGVTAASEGRQRIEFSGRVPDAADLSWPDPEGAYWSFRFTTGPLTWILPAEFPVSVKRPQAAVVASPK